MNKALVAGAVAVVLLAGVVAGWFYAQAEARKEVRRLFDEHDMLEELVTYKEVSYNPLSGALAIDGIRLEPGDDVDIDLPVRRLVLLEWEKPEGLIERLRFRIEGVALEIHELLQAIDSPTPERLSRGMLRFRPEQGLANPLYALYVTGYRQVDANIEIDYEFDSEEREMVLGAILEVTDVGRISQQIRLANVKPRLLKNLVKTVEALETQASDNTLQALESALSVNMPKMMQKMEKDANRIALASAYVEYEDAGFGRRYKKFAEDFYGQLPGERSVLLPSEEDLEEELEEVIREKDVPEEMARNMLETVVEFVEEPDRLEIGLEPDTPIRFSEWPRGLSDKDADKLIIELNITLDS